MEVKGAPASGMKVLTPQVFSTPDLELGPELHHPGGKYYSMRGARMRWVYLSIFL